MERMLGIDYGEKNVGIALSDFACKFAFPKTILPNDDNLLAAIEEIAQTEQVSIVVLGDTENPANGTNQITHRLAMFKAALEVRTGLPVELVSEAYTSAAARRAFEDRDSDRHKTTTPKVDAAAAALILQAHLDARKNKH